MNEPRTRRPRALVVHVRDWARFALSTMAAVVTIMRYLSDRC